jgi:hypothetical protein
MYYVQDVIPEAIQIVAGRDVPDEAFAEAVEAQVSLMARINPEEFGGLFSD